MAGGTDFSFGSLYLDLQTAQTNGPYTANALHFGIVGHSFGHFGGPGRPLGFCAWSYGRDLYSPNREVRLTNYQSCRVVFLRTPAPQPRTMLP